MDVGMALGDEESQPASVACVAKTMRYSVVRSWIQVPDLNSSPVKQATCTELKVIFLATAPLRVPTSHHHWWPSLLSTSCRSILMCTVVWWRGVLWRQKSSCNNGVTSACDNVTQWLQTTRVLSYSWAVNMEQDCHVWGGQLMYMYTWRSMHGDVSSISVQSDTCYMRLLQNHRIINRVQSIYVIRDTSTTLKQSTR